MKMSREGLAELAGHEGIALTKYKDSVGVWTIGLGATRTEFPDIASWPMDKSITIEEAFQLLKQHVVRYENAINKALIREIKQHQFDALVSWCYNVGTGWANKASVIKGLNRGADNSYLSATLLMFSKPIEIIGRRKKEAKLLTTGIYQNKGLVTIFPVSPKGRPQYEHGRVINALEYIS